MKADTRAKLIDPAIHKCGWTEDLIRREETAGAMEIINGRARRRGKEGVFLFSSLLFSSTTTNHLGPHGRGGAQSRRNGAAGLALDLRGMGNE